MSAGITDIPGIKVGHWTDREAATGCTVLLCEEGAVAGVDVRGPAPGTRETDLLDPGRLVKQVHAILLSGGSAYGLAAADGVMRYLEEREVGFDVGPTVIPIVPAAILFDLTIGSADVRPGAEEGYQACQSADDGPLAEGNVGAGTGATVGKLLGSRYATKAGLGSAGQRIGKGVTVAALVAVNALGDVVNPGSGKILGGTRKPVVGGFLNTAERIKGDLGQTILGLANTTIGVVATDARLDKASAKTLAQMAQDGLARAIRPAHTMLDGDTLFALSVGDRKADLSAVGAAAADVAAEAIARGVTQAESLHGVPAYHDLSK